MDKVSITTKKNNCLLELEKEKLNEYSEHILLFQQCSEWFGLCLDESHFNYELTIGLVAEYPDIIPLLDSEWMSH